jgi:hypothetical protein
VLEHLGVPRRSSRSGQGVEHVEVREHQPRLVKAPIRFLPRGVSMAVLPPTELSTWASRVVGPARIDPALEDSAANPSGRRPRRPQARRRGRPLQPLLQQASAEPLQPAKLLVCSPGAGTDGRGSRPPLQGARSAGAGASRGRRSSSVGRRPRVRPRKVGRSGRPHHPAGPRRSRPRSRARPVRFAQTRSRRGARARQRTSAPRSRRRGAGVSPVSTT